MNYSAVRTIAQRDIAVMLRTRAVLTPAVLMPLLIVGMTSLAVLLVSQSGRRFEHIYRLMEFMDAYPLDPSQPVELQLALIGAQYLIPTALIVVPLVIVSLLATDAVAGERERGTMEGLMLAPVSERDILLGKLAGPYLVSLVIGFSAHFLFAVAVNLALAPRMGALVLPTVNWAITVFWFGPAFTALALSVVILISARARTVQAAYQTSGALVVPIVILVLGQSAGLFLTSPWGGFLAGGVLFLLSAMVLLRGSSSLSRERQLTTLP